MNIHRAMRSSGALRPAVSAFAGIVAAVLLVAGLPGWTGTSRAAGPCDPGSAPVVCENSKPGNPETDWRIDGSYGDIVGFGTASSVQPGETTSFKVSTSATAWHIDIYRLGWYQGNGGRLITRINPSGAAQTQPACVTDPATALYDCGNWSVSATWTVPAGTVSGYFVANFIRDDGTAGANQFPFIVRDDTSHSALLVQASDETWQAYNKYGGSNLYQGTNVNSGDTRAYKVSYNRPYTNSGTATFMNAEMPMLRWLERNGYDVSYVSGTDTARNGALLLNHKVYISSGHDEYVAGTQRTNIENARANGVNLAFFSGNETFWKTRFESSIAGPSTSYRTLVCYKETKAEAKIDPSPEWTGTWRDPTVSPPSDGGRPENALTGTLYRMNGNVYDQMVVDSRYSALRFWRNTRVATLATGQSVTFFAGSLGYEYDEDADNGVRPAGAIELSQTAVTKTSGQLVLQDYGNTYGTGTVNHSLVLYRDPTSNAIVFGAGTVQWSWGLDNDHWIPSTMSSAPATDPAFQQATVNLFADMGVQPATLMSGLVVATASTDHTGPTATITAPASGASVPAGSSQTITGTATDAGGGSVAGVEVSVDGGATYHRATPTGANGSWSTWSYAWTAGGQGAATLTARATDDSVNIGAVATTKVTVGAQSCPCTIFGNQTPTTVDSNDAASYELGTRFTTSVNAVATGVRFYKSAGNTGTHTGTIWSPSGTRLGSGTFTNETASGWQTLTLASPVQLTAGTVYTVSYTTTTGHYSGDAGYFTGKGAGVAPVTAPASTTGQGNGVFAVGSGFPTSTYGDTNYWVDVTVSTSGVVQDTTPPTVTSVSPADASSGVAATTSVTATFNKPVSTTGLTFGLTGPGGTAVAGATTLAGDGLSATFAPSTALAASTSYTASVRAQDPSGNVMPAAKTWSFTTGAAATPGSCPCTVFGTQTPTIVDAGDTGTVELGMRVVPSADAQVTGVRFYKDTANTGTHTGSLWGTDGTLLASGTFTGESASGWQTLTFSSPVPVTGGKTYIVSYKTTSGHYSADLGYFTGKGAGAPPVTAPASTTTAPNGLYKYGGGFPTGSWKDANYWVDVLLAGTQPPVTDTTPPALAGSSPASGATGVPITATVTATFNKKVQSTGLKMTLTGPGGASVAGTTALAADGLSATFTPSASLAATTSYTASVTATDVAGNAMKAPATWSFTTATAAGCPCTVFGTTSPTTVDGGDPTAVELGMRFVSSIPATVTGVRFYKSASNTGTHTGSLWAADGTLLATGTFTGESATGWQMLTFSSPVPIAANRTYLVSYTTTTGHYSADVGYFTTKGAGTAPVTAPASTASTPNGVYKLGTGFPTASWNDSNYWVDPVVSDQGADTTAPTVTAKAPAAGASGVAAGVTVTATLSKPADPASLSFTLTGPGGTAVTARKSLSADGKTATLEPAANLAAATTYTATLSVTDLVGNAMAPVTWSFTTDSSNCPCSVFRASDAPAGSANDGTGVELGMTWVPQVNGSVTALRFWKATGDTGTHTGSLWTASGQLLSTGTYTNESAGGWQTLTLSAPVQVTAGTTYVVSYFSPTGRFGYTRGYFTSDRVNGPLTAPADSTTAVNGRYRYNGSSIFPASGGNGANYYVDVVFTTP